MIVINRQRRLSGREMVKSAVSFSYVLDAAVFEDECWGMFVGDNAYTASNLV